MIQLGVIGSMQDMESNKKIQSLAREVGKEIAKVHAALLFSYEGDFESFSTIAASAAEKIGGQTVAFLWGEQKKIKRSRALKIATAQLRGGGREFAFIRSCDAIIAIGGGSGTLMEFAMAYQARIPIVVLEKSGGWSEKLENTFLDERKKLKILSARTAQEAIILALQFISRKK